MKQIIALVLICTISIGLSAQTAGFELRSTLTQSITKESLFDATSLSDLNEGYPSEWISEHGYIATKISILYKDNRISAAGEDIRLSEEQTKLLSKAKMGSHIEFEVLYKNKNVITKQVSPKSVSFVRTLVPSQEAQFSDGIRQLNQLLIDKGINVLVDYLNMLDQVSVVSFWINEEGFSQSIKVERSSNDAYIDEQLTEWIRTMPQWIPAKNEDHHPVSQKFELMVGGMIGC